MPDLPTGTVTFFLTDIEGSTHLWDEFPEAMRQALTRHDELAASFINRHEGLLVKSRGEGDSLFAVFPRATDAVAAACAFGQALVTENWPASTPLRARVALHTGDADVRDGDYFGAAVNRCARLRSAAHGGQLLLSLPTTELARDSLPAGASLKELGWHRLKDLQRPEQVFQLLHPGLPADFPPLRSLETLPNNLPQQPTSFIGRESELREVRSLLSKTRLLTLTGSGGCGKTRLELQVAADVLEEFPDGVWVVELASLADPALVPQTAAQILKVSEEPGKPILPTLIRALTNRHLLLVLDNCEHLLTACAQLVDALLKACPQVKILASSREGLNVAGELTYRVPSLSLPERGRAIRIETLHHSEAARLFIERAQFHQPHFAITNQNAPALVSVCYHLDGIPLAIELAAARVRSMPVEQIASRLDDRFHLLTGGSRTALPRQQTLRALIDWSYDLLSEPERRLLRRLAAFAGGWTLEAAEAICTGAGIESWDVLDLLGGLVDKSLIGYEERDGQARYSLLETVREYAREKWLQTDDASSVQRQHFDYYLALAEAADRPMPAVDYHAWLGRLEADHDNLRMALDWCAKTPGAEELELRMVVALGRFWMSGSHWEEGLQYFNDALSRPAARTRLRATALRKAGNFTGARRDLNASKALVEEALEIFRELGETLGIADALGDLSLYVMQLGDVARARALVEEGLTLLESIPDVNKARHLYYSGWVLIAAGEYDQAERVLDEVVALDLKKGETGGSVHSLRGHLAFLRGDYREAEARYRAALVVYAEQQNKSHTAYSLFGLGRAALKSHQPARAARLMAAGTNLFEAIHVSPLPYADEQVGRKELAEESGMSADDIDAAWVEGSAMSTDQAIEYALNGEESSWSSSSP